MVGLIVGIDLNRHGDGGGMRWPMPGATVVASELSPQRVSREGGGLRLTEGADAATSA